MILIAGLVLAKFGKYFVDSLNWDNGTKFRALLIKILLFQPFKNSIWYGNL